MITHISLALIYVQNSITMPHIAVRQLMRVIKWPRSDSDGNCVNKNVHGNKGFYSIAELTYCLYRIDYTIIFSFPSHASTYTYTTVLLSPMHTDDMTTCDTLLVANCMCLYMGWHKSLLQLGTVSTDRRSSQVQNLVAATNCD